MSSGKKRQTQFLGNRAIETHPSAGVDPFGSWPEEQEQTEARSCWHMGLSPSAVTPCTTALHTLLWVQWAQILLLVHQQARSGLESLRRGVIQQRPNAKHGINYSYSGYAFLHGFCFVLSLPCSAGGKTPSPSKKRKGVTEAIAHYAQVLTFTILMQIASK